MEDLIYTDASLRDVGVLQTYTLDLDLAKEKDFELKTPDPVLQSGSYIYIPGTEYGGIVDCVESDSANHQVTYTGRSFRGILNKKVIDTTRNGVQITLHGTLTEIGNTLLQEQGLDDQFIFENADKDDEVSDEVYGLAVGEHCTLYEAITKAAASINFTYVYNFVQSDRKVHITPVLAEDYSEYLSYCQDNSISFTVKENNGGINHLVCTGVDEDGKAITIHLFTDENGGILPYATTDTPLQDSDYILDKSQQRIFGIQEIAEILNESVATVENYVMLTSRPADWKERFEDYYKLAETEDEESEPSYESVTGLSGVYSLTTSKPSDWNTNYGDYYTHSGTGQTDEDYSSVSTVEVLDTSVQSGTDHPGYTVLRKRPADWVSTYGNYFVRTWDGTRYHYENVQGKEVSQYIKQTRKPSDWKNGFSSYYQRKKKKFVSVSGNKKGNAPKWKKNKYFTRRQHTKAPAFPSVVFIQHNKSVVPSWESGTYYSKSDTKAPEFISGMFYKKVYDNYANMVDEGKQRIAESRSTAEQSVTLDDFEVRIGDTVGGEDVMTGLVLCEEVTNMIVKIKGGVPTIEYEIGGNDTDTEV